MSEDIGNTIQPYYSSDEQLLLDAMSGQRYMNKRDGDIDKTQEQINSNIQSDMNENPYDYQHAYPETLDEHEFDSNGSGNQDGGFVQALLPLLPVLGSVLPSLISGIVNLFKKKGSGVYPPNYRGGLGGFNVNDYVKTRFNVLQGYEDELKNKMKGVNFWKYLKEILKKELFHILQTNPQIGNISEKVANQSIDKLFEQIFPSNFHKLILGKIKKSESGGSILRPVGRYAIDEIFDGDDNARKYYGKKWKSYDLNDDELYGSGVKEWWGNFRGKLKTFLGKMLNSSSPLIGKAVDMILEKFGMENPNLRGIISGITENASKNIGEKLGSGFDMNDIGFDDKNIIPEFSEILPPSPLKKTITKKTRQPRKTKQPRKTRAKKVSGSGKKKEYTVTLL
jgi:hypothetical protein